MSLSPSTSDCLPSELRSATEVWIESAYAHQSPLPHFVAEDHHDVFVISDKVPIIAVEQIFFSRDPLVVPPMSSKDLEWS